MTTNLHQSIDQCLRKVNTIIAGKILYLKNLFIIIIFVTVNFGLVYTQTVSDISGSYTFKPVRLGGGGFVTGFAAHPKGEEILYCRTDVGGAYRWNSTDSIWEQLYTMQRMPFLTSVSDSGVGTGVGRTSALSTLAIGLDPNNLQVVYLVSNIGLVKSTDRGNSFTFLPEFGKLISVNGNDQSGDRTSGERLQIDPGNSDNMLFGSQYSGMYISSDAGISWSQVDTAQIPVQNTGGVEWIKYYAPGKAYASVKYNGIYQTVNGGLSWSLIHSIPSPDVSPHGVYINGILWVAVNNGSKGGVFKYNGTWINTNCPSASIDAIAVDSVNNSVYAIESGYNFYRLTDGGNTWTTLSRNVYSSIGWKNLRFNLAAEYLSVGNITIDPANHSNLWFDEGMGMWHATISDNNNSPQFIDISNGIEEFCASDIASSHNGIFTVSVWDRQGFTIADPDNFPASETGCSGTFSSSMSIDANPTNPNFLTFCVSDFGRWGCCGENSWSCYSSNRGKTWTRFGCIDKNGNTSYNAKLSYPYKLYAGEIVSSANDSSNMVWVVRSNQNLIYYSNNLGTTWTRSNISPNWSGPNETYLSTRKILTADALTTGKFYTYSSLNGGNTYYSVDNGANWSIGGAVAKNCFHCQMKHAPGKAGHVWFCAGFDQRTADPAQNGLYFSYDGSTTYKQIPGVTVCWALGFGAPAPGSGYPTLYIYGLIGGNWGVYQSTDSATTWNKLVDFPLGSTDQITAIEGDADIYGRVYIGFSGSGFAYGQGPVVNVNGVKLDSVSATVMVGNSCQLADTVYPLNASNQTVIWSSDNTDFAKVNTKGLVTGIAVGTDTVKVTTEDGGYNAICIVDVIANPSEKVDEISYPGIDLYPNPATNEVLITNIPSCSTVNVIDIMGRDILSLTNQNLIDVSGLSAGTYIVHIVYDSNNINKLFIKK